MLVKFNNCKNIRQYNYLLIVLMIIIEQINYFIQQ